MINVTEYKNYLNGIYEGVVNTLNENSDSNEETYMKILELFYSEETNNLLSEITSLNFTKDRKKLEEKVNELYNIIDIKKESLRNNESFDESLFNYFENFYKQTVNIILKENKRYLSYIEDLEKVYELIIQVKSDNRQLIERLREIENEYRNFDYSVYISDLNDLL